MSRTTQRQAAGPARRIPSGKLAIPPLTDDLVLRPRCTAAVDQALDGHRVVVVAAPAGFGKSTLLAQWASSTTAPVLWASLDRLDDDPGRLIGLLGELASAAGRRVPSPARPGDLAPSLAQQVDDLVDLVDRLPAPPVFVLDDVHHLSLSTGEPVIAPLLRAPGARFVLATRHEVPLRVQRLRLAGVLGEVGPATLALTATEVAALADRSGTAVVPGAVAALHEVTDGWPVAVRLAVAAGLAGRPVPPEHLTGQDVPLADYLVEEVLGPLPADLAGFLLRSCAAPTVDPALAAALVPGGAALLDDCVRRGLFLTPVTEDGAVLPRYRWHPLVAAHARALLARRDPAAAAGALRVVAEHLAATDPASAVQHAVDGDAPELAARILAERWPELMVRGEAHQVGRLRALLPEPHRDRPGVLLAGAAASAAQPRPCPVGPALPVRGPAAALDALVRTFLTAPRAAGVDGLRPVEQLLVQAGPDPAVRTFGDYLVGRAEVFGPVGALPAVRRLTRAAAAATARGWSALHLACRAALTLARCLAGDPDRALAEAHRVLVAAAAHGWRDHALTSAAHLAIGAIAYLRDDLAGAEPHLRVAADRAAPHWPDLAVHATGVLGLLHLARGDAAGLTRCRDALEPAPDRAVPGAGQWRTALTAVQHEQQRRPVEALDLVRRLPVGFPLVDTWRADLLRQTGDLAAARTALRTAVRRTGGDPGGTPAHLRVAQLATGALLAEDAPTAHGILEQALDAARPAHLVRPLRRLAAELRPLLSAHLEWGSVHEELVIALLLAEESAPRTRGSVWELTPRERDVLACLRSSLTAEEIAASMFLSLNTVKSHLRSIYRKLGVPDRRSAVRTAVQRGLL